MHKYLYTILAIIIFSHTFGIFYNINFQVDTLDENFLTISTFLFAIFTGFFISRQGSRYTEVRDKLTQYDGEMSAIYRSAKDFGADTQKKIGKVIHDYYDQVLNNHSWDFPFSHKATILTDIHAILRTDIGDKELATLQALSLDTTKVSLSSAQVVRKNVIALVQERIPRAQWIIVFILSAILLITLSVSIFSLGLILAPMIKAAFATTVIFVLILLYQLDQLNLFENTIGEVSARDVLEIIDGIK